MKLADSHFLAVEVSTGLRKIRDGREPFGGGGVGDVLGLWFEGLGIHERKRGDNGKEGTW